MSTPDLLQQALDALKSIDARLRECSKASISAEDAYDSFYQELVLESIAAIKTRQAQPSSAVESPVVAQKFWLWRNFVDGRPEYWAFDNPYPINLQDGDPQTLGEPCGYAIFKPSRNGRPDVSEARVLAAIAAAQEAKP